MLQPELNVEVERHVKAMTEMAGKNAKMETRLSSDLTVTSYWCGSNVLRIDIKGFNNVNS